MDVGTWVWSTAKITVIYTGMQMRPLQLTRQKVIRYQYINGVVTIGLQLNK